jgi:hypothetical protein
LGGHVKGGDGGDGSAGTCGNSGSGGEVDNKKWVAVRAGGRGGGAAAAGGRIALGELEGMSQIERENAAMSGAMRVLV